MNNPDLYPYEEVKAFFESNKRVYEKANPGKNYDEDFYQITYDYLKKDRLNYVKFGLYWYAVKRVLAEKGFNACRFLDDNPPFVENAYVMRDPDGSINPLLTLSAGWIHRDEYNATYFQGNRDFTLFNGEMHHLSDPSFEQFFPRVLPELEEDYQAFQQLFGGY